MPSNCPPSSLHFVPLLPDNGLPRSDDTSEALIPAFGVGDVLVNTHQNTGDASSNVFRIEKDELERREMRHDVLRVWEGLKSPNTVYDSSDLTDLTDPLDENDDKMNTDEKDDDEKSISSSPLAPPEKLNQMNKVKQILPQSPNESEPTLNTHHNVYEGSQTMGFMSHAFGTVRTTVEAGDPSFLLRTQGYSCLLPKPQKLHRYVPPAPRLVAHLTKTTASSHKNLILTTTKNHSQQLQRLRQHADAFTKWHGRRKAKEGKVARAVRDYIGKRERRAAREAVDSERKRIQALKTNNLEEYNKLLGETKNKRLKFLLESTEGYLKKIGTMVENARKAAGDENENEIASGSGENNDKSNDKSYYEKAHSNIEVVTQPEALTGGKLKSYQLSGVQWMVSLYNNSLNGILADEMGLGKTIQTIGLISYLMSAKNNLGPYLIIVPLSTLSNWTNEFAKWFPKCNVITYKGVKDARKKLFTREVATGRFNVLVTTYEFVMKDKKSLKKLDWQYAIVDEGHRMKNANSKFSTILSTQYTTFHRILLTGTPLQNNLPELWSLLNFLLPSVFDCAETFDTWFNKPFSQFKTAAQGIPKERDKEFEDDLLSSEERLLIINRLHELLRPFMLRRVKAEVLDQLPEKVEKVVRCDLSAWQKTLYRQFQASAHGNGNKTGTLVKGLNNILMQLRKVCNHPYLFLKEGWDIDEMMIRCSGKFELLDRMLPKLKKTGHRVLIFTQMTQVMSVMEDYFEYRGYKHLRLDGSTAAEDREKRMKDFNAPDSPYFIFLLSTRAGGLGLNLATADTVIIFDSDWNPMMDLQAQDRAHRIGQRREVRVFRLITNSPVEEKILSRATEKLNMNQLAIEAGKFDMQEKKEVTETQNERNAMMEVLMADADELKTNAVSAEYTKTQIDSEEEEDEQEDDQEYEDEQEYEGGDNAREGEGKEPAEKKSKTEKGGKKPKSKLKSKPSSQDESRIRELIEAEGQALSELMAIDEDEFTKYCEVDSARADKIIADMNSKGEAKWGLVGEDEVPEFVRAPTDSDVKEKEKADIQEMALGRRKERVNYNDESMTEIQFIRKLEKEADEEEADEERRKAEEKLKRKGKKGLLKVADIKALSGVVGELLKIQTPDRILYSDVFYELPSKADFPDYYQVIKKPICISGIMKKLSSHTYTSIADFVADWNLIFSNARLYNEPDSWVCKFALVVENELRKLMDTAGLGGKKRRK